MASAMVLQASGTAPEVHLRERGFVVGVCGWRFVVGMGGQRFFVRDFYYEIRLRLRRRLRQRLLLLKLRLLRTTNIPRRGTSPCRRSRRSLARRRAWRPRGAWGPSGRRTEWGGAWGGGVRRVRVRQYRLSAALRCGPRSTSGLAVRWPASGETSTHPQGLAAWTRSERRVSLSRVRGSLQLSLRH